MPPPPRPAGAPRAAASTPSPRRSPASDDDALGDDARSRDGEGDDGALRDEGGGGGAASDEHFCAWSVVEGDEGLGDVLDGGPGASLGEV